jgi:hypothetical protein
MATSANVTATLIIKGQDQASAQIDKSSKAAERLSNNLKHASDSAGKFNHGLPGLEGKHDSFKPFGRRGRRRRRRAARGDA